jgi:hypothetical protein
MNAFKLLEAAIQLDSLRWLVMRRVTAQTKEKFGGQPTTANGFARHATLTSP